MDLDIKWTTAELVVGAVEACLLRPTEADAAYVAEFLDTTPDLAAGALTMASQLGFVRPAAKGCYVPVHPLSSYLAGCSSVNHRKALLRFALEQYAPFRTFRERLVRMNHAPRAAATQVIAVHGLKAPKDTVATTLTDLGQYAGSLVPEGANLYAPPVPNTADYLLDLGEVVDDDVACEAIVRDKLGERAAEWVDRAEVLGPLVIAYRKLREAETDPRTPILHAGMAVESFLSQFGNVKKHSLASCNGIIQRADSLRGACLLKTKHHGMLLFLGHIRNAADHGTDDREIGRTWNVTPDTAVAYVRTALSVVTAVVATLSDEYLV